MRRKDVIRFGLYLCIIVMVSAFAVAAGRPGLLPLFKPQAKKGNVTLAADLQRRAGTAEEKLFEEYLLRVKSIDPAREMYFQKGTLKIMNEEDQAILTPETSYAVYKKADECYYQLGHTETYNMQGLYVYIDHQRKEVILGNQKMLTGSPLAGLKSPGKTLREEGYAISAFAQGSLKKITLSNPKHPVCKAYTLVCDTLSGKVIRLMAVLASEKDPFEKGKGKILDIHITAQTDVADLNETNPFDVVQKDGDQWVLKDKFRGYTLHTL